MELTTSAPLMFDKYLPGQYIDTVCISDSRSRLPGLLFERFTDVPLNCLYFP